MVTELTKELDASKLALQYAEEKIRQLEVRIPGGDEKALTNSMVAKVECLKGALKMVKEKYTSERAQMVNIQEWKKES